MPSSVFIAIAAAGAAAGATALGATVFVAGLIGALAAATAARIIGPAFADQAPLEQQVRTMQLTVRQPVAPWRYIYGRHRVGGVITFMHQSTDDDGDHLHLVITFAAHPCEAIDTIWFDDFQLTLDGSGDATDRYAGFVHIEKSLGGTAQPFAGLVTASSGVWSNTHRQSNCTKIWVRLTSNPDLFPNGLPNITALIRGKNDIYDPRTSPGSAGYSTNPSLCIANFLCDTKVGLGAVYADEIDEDQLVAAANIDDELVTIAGPGSPAPTQARYTINGAFDVNAAPRDLLARMLTANAGKAIYIGGKWRILPAAYVTPTVTIDEDDLRAVPMVEPNISGADLFNGVKGLHMAEGNLFQPSDYPPVAPAAYLAEDEDERKWRDLDLPFTRHVAMCQRIASVELERIRRQITVKWPGKLTCYQLQPGDSVMVTFSMMGWSAKVFEVVQSTLVFEEAEGGVRLGCDLVLRETDSNVYGWSTAGETTVDDSPATDLPDPFNVSAPSNLAFDEEAYQWNGEGYLTWDESSSADVTYQAEYKLATASTYTQLPLIRGDRKRITGLAPGTYNMRVRAVSGLGVPSAYAGPITVELVAPEVPRVSGLELFNDNNLSTEFAARDAMFVWRSGASQGSVEPGQEAVAGEGARDPFFKDYLVKIYDEEGNLVREEPESAVLQPRYTYTYANNQLDNGGVPLRTFRIKVWGRGRQNQLSSIPAQLTVSNPQCGQPSSVSVRASYRSLYVEWTPPSAETDPDVEGILVWVSTANGFTPSGTAPGSGTCKYKGPDRLVAIDNLSPATTYYIRVACFDSFGVDDLTLSTQLTVTTPQVSTADIEIEAIVNNLIASGAVTVDKMTVANLAAITAAMGSLTSGDITLNASGHIKSGQSAYNTGSGWWLGRDGGTAKFSIGNPAGPYLIWDGAALSVRGTLNATDLVAGTLDVDRITVRSIETGKLDDDAVSGAFDESENIDADMSSGGSNIFSVNSGDDNNEWESSAFSITYNAGDAAYKYLVLCSAYLVESSGSGAVRFKPTLSLTSPGGVSGQDSVQELLLTSAARHATFVALLPDTSTSSGDRTASLFLQYLSGAGTATVRAVSMTVLPLKR